MWDNIASEDVAVADVGSRDREVVYARWASSRRLVVSRGQWKDGMGGRTLTFDDSGLDYTMLLPKSIHLPASP